MYKLLVAAFILPLWSCKTIDGPTSETKHHESWDGRKCTRTKHFIPPYDKKLHVCVEYIGGERRQYSLLFIDKETWGGTGLKEENGPAGGLYAYLEKVSGPLHPNSYFRTKTHFEVPEGKDYTHIQMQFGDVNRIELSIDGKKEEIPTYWYKSLEFPENFWGDLVRLGMKLDKEKWREHKISSLNVSCTFENKKSYKLRRYWLKTDRGYVKFKFERDDLGNWNSNVFTIPDVSLYKYFSDYSKTGAGLSRAQLVKYLDEDLKFRTNYQRDAWEIKSCK